MSFLSKVPVWGWVLLGLALLIGGFFIYWFAIEHKNLRALAAPPQQLSSSSTSRKQQRALIDDQIARGIQREPDRFVPKTQMDHDTSETHPAHPMDLIRDEDFDFVPVAPVFSEPEMSQEQMFEQFKFGVQQESRLFDNARTNFYDATRKYTEYFRVGLGPNSKFNEIEPIPIERNFGNPLAEEIMGFHFASMNDKDENGHSAMLDVAGVDGDTATEEEIKAASVLLQRCAIDPSCAPEKCCKNGWFCDPASVVPRKQDCMGCHKSMKQ